MNFTSTTQLLKGRLAKGDVLVSTGRFKPVRRAYSFLQNKRQQLSAKDFEASLHPRPSHLFTTQKSVETFVEEMNKDAVSFGLQLDPSAVTEIHNYALATPCTEPDYAGTFLATEVADGKLGDRLAFRGLVQSPEQCPPIKQLAEDETLLKIVRSYLNYWPTKLTYHLTWSFATTLPEKQAKNLYPPLSYHFDVAGYNFMTTYFYITDVEEDSGPHVMIVGSHNQKPMGAALTPSSGRPLDSQIVNHYGKARELTITGKSGFGYMQDPSCFHKLVAPRRQNRLLLQIRYA